MKQAPILMQRADEKHCAWPRFTVARPCQTIRRSRASDEPAVSTQTTLWVLMVMMILVSIAAFCMFWAKLAGTWPFAP